MTAAVTPAEAEGLVTFDTVDPGIATVVGFAPDLTMIGVATGTTQVQAIFQGVVRATAAAHVVRVQLSPSPVYLCRSGTATLTASVIPGAAAGQVTFDAADSGIATVSGSAPDLTVTGGAAGTTQVRAQLGTEQLAVVADVYR